MQESLNKMKAILKKTAEFQGTPRPGPQEQRSHRPEWGCLMTSLIHPSGSKNASGQKETEEDLCSLRFAYKVSAML